MRVTQTHNWCHVWARHLIQTENWDKVIISGRWVTTILSPKPHQLIKQHIQTVQTVSMCLNYEKNDSLILFYQSMDVEFGKI